MKKNSFLYKQKYCPNVKNIKKIHKMDRQTFDSMIASNYAWVIDNGTIIPCFCTR